MGAKVEDRIRERAGPSTARDRINSFTSQINKMPCTVLGCEMRQRYGKRHSGTCVLADGDEYLDIYPSYIVRAGHMFGCMRHHNDEFCGIFYSCLVCRQINYCTSLIKGEPPYPNFFCEYCIAKEKYPDDLEITDGVEYAEQQRISADIIRVNLKWEGDEWLRKWNQVKALESCGFPRPALERIAEELGVKDFALS